MNQPSISASGARLTGFVYLAYFMTAIPGGMLLKRYVTPHDAAATADAINANESLFRLGLTLDISANVLYLALAALLYGLLAPVGRRAALMAALFAAAGCSVQLIGDLVQSMVPILLRDADLAAAFGAETRQTAAMLSLKAYSQVFNISLVLFGLFDVLIGWLILRSGYLPSLLGLAFIAAGCGWLIFLWPPLALKLSVYILPPGMLAEVMLMLWLLAFGVNRTKWRERTKAAST